MSVIRDLSHHKKNVVLELFGNSKRHIPQNENYQQPKLSQKKIFQQLITPHPSNVLTLIQNTPLTLNRVANKHKNYESQELRRYSSRRKQMTLTIDEPQQYIRNVVSHHRDFRSQISIEYNPLSTCNSRKNSMVFTPNQSHQQNLRDSGVKRSNSFRDLFKSSIRFG
ncbi:hypothetical protein pb186bvf_004109 [Paramecium bursaria]